MALHDNEEAWFANRAVFVMIGAKIDTWEETENKLKETLWVEKMGVKIWGSFWHGVREMKSPEKHYRPLRVRGKDVDERDLLEENKS